MSRGLDAIPFKEADGVSLPRCLPENQEAATARLRGG